MNDAFADRVPGPKPTDWRPLVLATILGVVIVAAAMALLFVDFRRLLPPNASVTFDITVEQPGTIAVDGKTDLPEGTVINWDLVSGSYFAEGGGGLIKYGQTTVTNGGFRMRIDAAPMQSGTLLGVGVRFYPGDEQPAAVSERFGPNGERLQGPDVLDDSGTPVLLVVREVTVP
jgi:hypothetical protein